MCFLPKNKSVAPATGQPEKLADPSEVGSSRKQEDQALFGGVPDLRVDRSATAGGTTAGGTGLRME